MLSGIYFIVTLCAILSFLHSSLFVFKNPNHKNKTTKLFLKIPTLLLWFSFPIHFLFVPGSINLQSLPLALVFSSMALMVYWFSVYSKRNYTFSVIHSDLDSSGLCRDNIYSLVAHPFYLAYIIGYVSIFLAMPNLIHFFLTTLLIAVYFRAAYQEKHQILQSSIGAEYKAYLKTVGMFFPRFF